MTRTRACIVAWALVLAFVAAAAFVGVWLWLQPSPGPMVACGAGRYYSSEHGRCVGLVECDQVVDGRVICDP